ncbi:MAG: hypothetical protein QOG64_1528, partial [Acidimicrobiaceae bacterium]|nr:hypothetical protein [Acidimicrobiaceae bacterium]
MNQTHEPRGDAFRVAHPVDLLLRNSDGEAVLRILEEDSPGEDLHVSLENRSDTTFSLQQPAKPEPRPSNYHIELRFRPGVLDTTRLREVQLVHKDTAEAEEASWQLSHQRNDEGTVSFFLLHEYGTEISPGERLHLALTNIRVAASAGSRPTLVEVVVRSGPAQARRSLPGDIQRVDRIRLVNRRGRPALPLVAAWAGTDTILNDGESQNELVLDLINTGAEPIELDATGLDSASTFVVSDSVTHDLDPRRLGDAAELANMEIDVTTPGWTVTVDDEGPRPQWIMRPVEATVLKPGDSLSMRLSNLVSDADSGPAELAIDYANIPGYWDGRCSAVIRKAPLLYYRGVDGRTRVGVYTSHPRLDLSIGLPGTGLQADVDGRLELWAGDRKALVIGGDGAVTVVDHLSVGQPEAAIAGSEDGHLRLRTAGTDRLTIDA